MAGETTTTTWTVVMILLVMNYGANSTLEGFAFILALGVLVGTYSSIFIASPLLVLGRRWAARRAGTAAGRTAEPTARRAKKVRPSSGRA